MKQPKYSPKESLYRAKLMMGYDPTNTLTENKQKLKSLIKEGDSQNQKAFRKAVSICGSRPNNEGTLDAGSIAAALNKAFNYGEWYTFGYGTDDSVWQEQVTKMKKGNLDDWCNIVREYEDVYEENFADGVIGDLDDSELAEFMEAYSAMKYRSDKESKLAVASTEQKNINWFKKAFPCIFDSDGNVDQNVYKNSNNYVYILIKGTSGSRYQVFADGRVKKENGTSTGKKVSCQGSTVKFINESVEKKSLSEQIDDSELGGTSTPNPNPNPNPSPNPRPRPAYRDCTGTYKKGCKSDVILKVQGCLGLSADGKYGKNTDDKLKSLGFTSFTDADVDKICTPPEISGEVVKVDPSNTNF